VETKEAGYGHIIWMSTLPVSDIDIEGHDEWRPRRLDLDTSFG